MVTFNNDIDVLNYALTLEHFEAALYKALIGANLLTGVEAQYLTTFGAQEQQHVDTLTGVISKLGGTPVAAPASYNFAAAGPITNRDQTIHAVEGEHASIFRDMAGMAPAPDAVAKGRTPDEVLAIVTPFLQTPAPVPSAPPRTGGGGDAAFIRRLGDG
ncbi:MAG: ferritin-like domain-containing protein [Thermomicrobia bacterium]|nr:ferritin-like domain-containing protein [Thermomicrobia bacterium]